MNHAIRIHRPGGPEAMVWEPVPIGPPGPGEVLLRQTAIGVNYIDVYYRTGLYRLDLPAVMGRSGLGVVEIRIARRIPLADAAEAHRALESRAVMGSLVMIP